MRTVTMKGWWQGLNGSKIFSELGLNMGFHQLELESKSRELTTFATHSGLYRYKRPLFGINSENEVFQCKIASAFEGATNISDNIVVHIPDKETTISKGVKSWRG